MNSPLTAFAGHRSLDEAFFPLVLDAVQAALERDSGLVVGCCTGADDQVIRAAMMLGATHRLTILAAFGPQGEGAFELSAVDTVLDATALGADTRFLAGGPVEQPLATRLVAAHARRDRRASPRRRAPGGLLRPAQLARHLPGRPDCNRCRPARNRLRLRHGSRLLAASRLGCVGPRERRRHAGRFDLAGGRGAAATARRALMARSPYIGGGGASVIGGRAPPPPATGVRLRFTRRSTVTLSLRSPFSGAVRRASVGRPRLPGAPMPRKEFPCPTNPPSAKRQRPPSRPAR